MRRNTIVEVRWTEFGSRKLKGTSGRMTDISKLGV